MNFCKSLIWSAIVSIVVSAHAYAGMDGIPSLTVEEAGELGFEIKLEHSADANCRINVSVTAPESLDGRKYLGMNYALYRGEKLLFWPDGLNAREHSFLIAVEMLPTLVVLPVYVDDKRGYGYQILFSDIEWPCE